MKLSDVIDRYFIKQPRLRRAVTRLLYGAQVGRLPVLGAPLHLDAVRENGYWRAARAAQYLSVFRDEAPAITHLANLLQGACAFVDVGANVGLWSASMSRLRRLHPALRVVAFEVDPDTYQRLAATAAEQGFEAVHAGVGARAETARFVGGAVSHVTTRVEMANAYSIPRETFEAAIIALDNFEFGTLDLVIKIDVEGQEWAVLQGARRLFADQRVRCVYIDGYDDPRCRDFLLDHGFRLLDGRTLDDAVPDTFSLLGVRRDAERRS